MEPHDSTTESKRFGQYLRRIREERKLSLDSVEEMSLGFPDRVTKSHLSRIENGQAVPTFPRMFTLSRIYGIPVSSLAERFEICLMRGMFPPDLDRKSDDDVLHDARTLRMAGRHAEALILYEALIERRRREETGADRRGESDLQLECVNCLVQLARYVSAKEKCEDLLSTPELGAREKVVALHYYATCCYRLGKFTVALMAIDSAERDLAALAGEDRLPAHLAALKGNVLSVTGRAAEATGVYSSAMAQFEQLADSFEACRMRLNLAAALIENGDRPSAKQHLEQALRTAEAEGYDRQNAFALSHLALMTYQEDDLDAAEAYCLRSNRIARPREYVSVVFRNSYYLWRIAQKKGDESAARTYERTLRTYLSRVEDYLPEADDYRSHVARLRRSQG